MTNSCLGEGHNDMGFQETLDLEFTVNGSEIKVPVKSLDPTLSLARFLRQNLHLTGTKISCGQGGCGACIVTALISGSETKAVNSCLTPVLSCQGWKITTIEGLGSKKSGLHPIQQRLATFHGTQCGFCSPGMVMSMNSLRESRETEPSLKEIENILDGNICRCTGYRPILDAFKSFAADAPEDLKKKVADIEDLICQNGKMCPTTKEPCLKKCSSDKIVQCFSIDSEVQWFAPKSAGELMKLLKSVPNPKRVKLVAGNTGSGIYPAEDKIDVYIDINQIQIDQVSSKSPLTVGAGMTLTKFMNLMEDLGKSDPKWKFGKEMAKHLLKVANVGVRNRGTMAGNLMLKHKDRTFPSDLFILLEGVGAKLIVTDSNGTTSKLSLQDWLEVSMEQKLLNSIEFPGLEENHIFRTFKIASRSQNAHTYVSGAFLAKVNSQTLVIEEQPTIVFAGISSSFLHASETEALMKGMNVNDQTNLNKIMSSLHKEIIPDDNPVNTSPEYRRQLAQALVYKFVLSILGDQARPELRSGSTQVIRGVSRGGQHYETNPELYPINKPIQKLEGDIQCSGEAEYVDDIPGFPYELHGAFVISEVANCELDSVDPSDALAISGVQAFLDHSDIPGENHWALGRFRDEIFSSGKIHFAGQSIGLIVAESPDLAQKAAKLVKVTYKNKKKPILTIQEAIQTEGYLNKDASVHGTEAVLGEDPIEDDSAVKTITGEFEIGSQYHFHLETQTCLVRPIEEGQFEVNCSTQWIDKTQEIIAKALGIPLNLVDMKVRRLGGAYGGKIEKCNLSAAACAVAANKLNVPVRIVLDIKTNMEMLGKRLPYYAKYKVMVTPEGVLKSVGIKMYCDCGDNFNSPTVDMAKTFSQNCYHSEKWRVSPNAVLTNTPSNTYVRAPGTTQGHAIIETIMEHAAMELGMDPLEFRLKNILKKGDKLLAGGEFEDEMNPVKILIEQVQNSSKFQERKSMIQEFNEENRWKKRGISLIPVRYRHNYYGTKFHVHISIFDSDGTVALSHGGIEMGQGLNTKVAQVVAKEFGISMDMIKVKPSSSLIAPNNSCTGGSMGSECCASAAELACRELKARMKKVKDSLPSKTSWVDLVKACSQQAIDMTARHMGHTGNDKLQGYDIWAAVVTEVELDVLTGEMNIRRADLIEDTGSSISPEVDVGQVEGGYIMGLGMWTTEKIKHDPITGKLLTNDTWEYKPPSSQDIPEDLRTTFYNSKRNPYGVLGSKATGEPCVLMGVGVMFAIRDAINAIKKDLGADLKTWYRMDAPATVDNIQTTTGVGSQHYKI